MENNTATEPKPATTPTNLGWQNDWKGVLPDVVKDCQAKRHIRDSFKSGSTRRIVCDQCKYQYQVDSGD